LPFIHSLRADRPRALDSHQYWAIQATNHDAFRKNPTRETHVTTSPKELDLSSQSMDIDGKTRHSQLSKLDQFTGQFDNLSGLLASELPICVDSPLRAFFSRYC